MIKYLLPCFRICFSLAVVPAAVQFSFAHETPDKSHIRYIENKGQWNDNILFKTELGAANIYLEKNGFTYDLFNPSDLARVYSLKLSDPNHTITDEEKNIQAHAFKMFFEGCNANISSQAFEPAPYYHNYFLGNDPAKWAGGVQLFEEVEYTNLYDGIDLHVYSSDEKVKYDFIIRNGIDPSLIQLKYEGADKIFVRDGKLHIVTSVNTLIEHIPLAFQMIKGKTVEVDCEYELDGNTVKFILPDGYNHDYDLIIDPTLIFSTYSGSTADNWGYTATYDESGNMFSAGIVFGSGYPTTSGAYDITFGGGTGSYPCDVSITKFEPNGTALIYSTYLGGNGNETPHSCIVNDLGELIIFGATSSTNFATTAGCYDNTFGGGTTITVSNVIQFNGCDIFVTHFNVDGTGLVGSTYVGGTGNEGLNTAASLKYNYADHSRGEVIIDNANNILVTSNTFSNNFPTTAGAYQTASAGLCDAVVFQMNPALTQLTWSTYLGGANDDAAYSVKMNDAGEIYVCGGTKSSNFPTTAGTFHTTFQGGITDGFISHLNGTGTTLMHSSYLGTNLYDQAYILDIDWLNNIYVFGQSLGSYPVTAGIYSNAGAKQFLHKMDPTLSITGFSTVVGNGSLLNISPTAILVDLCNNIYLAGWGGAINVSYSGNPGMGYTTGLPTTAGAYQTTTDGSDFYFMVLYPDATALLYATFFGGSTTQEHVDGGTSRFDDNGVIYEAVCAGCGGSSAFPTTPGAWSNTNNSFNCNEGSIKFEFQFAGVTVNVQAFPTVVGCAPLTVDFSSTGTNVFGWEWYFGDGSPVDYSSSPSHTYLNPGIYSVMLVGIDSLSCDTTFTDTAFLNVFVIQSEVIPSFTSSVILGCDSMVVNITNTSDPANYFLWDFGNGQTATTGSIGQNPTAVYYTPGQTYTITLIAVDTLPCPAIDTFTLTVTYPPFEPPPIADFTYTIDLDCDTLTVYFENLSSGGTAYGWDMDNGDFSLAFEPVTIYTVMDTYYVTLTVLDTGFCPTTSTITIPIIFNNQTNPINADFNYTFLNNGCDSLEVQFNNTSTGNAVGYYWDFGNGQTSNLFSPSTTYQNSGSYTIMLVALDTGICAKNDTIIQVLDYFTDSTNALAQFTFNQFPFCDSMQVYFVNNSSGADYYFWDFGNGSTSAAANPQITYTVQGTYNVMFIAVDTGFCAFSDTAFATINFIVNSVPVTAAFTPAITATCSDRHVDLTNNSTGTNQYLWDFGNGITSSQVNPTATYIFPGTYTITLIAVDTGLCSVSDTATFDVTFLPEVIADFTKTPDGCAPLSVDFTNATQNGLTYQWDFGNGTTSTLTDVTVLYSTAGNYSVILIAFNPGTCNLSDTISLSVSIYDVPVADFIYAPDQVTTAIPVQFTNQSQGATIYAWDFGDGTSSSDVDPLHGYFDSEVYKICLEASNQFGCWDSLCRVIPIQEGVIDVPTAFSPNGDGINDFVFVRGYDIADLVFRIFNRWGELVFETHDQSVGWDGIYNGVKQEMEVYVWTLDATLDSGKEVFKKGNVTLLR